MKTVSMIAGLLLWGVANLAVADQGIENTLAATFRVVGQGNSGTGFAVRTPTGDFLVTAAHFFEGAGNECRLILREVKDEDFVRRELVVPLKKDLPLWRKHSQVDVGIMPITLPTDVAIKPFELAQLADENAYKQHQVRVAQEVWIPGFPAQLEGNEAGWPVLRHGSIASHPLMTTKVVPNFLIDATTFGGDSGAPVVVHPAASAEKSAGNAPLVVGVLIGMQRQTSKASLEFQEFTNHTPMGLAIIVPSVFVRELLENPNP